MKAFLYALYFRFWFALSMMVLVVLAAPAIALRLINGQSMLEVVGILKAADEKWHSDIVEVLRQSNRSERFIAQVMSWL